MDQEQGLIIARSSDDGEELRIQGTLSIFTKCGSQYAIWYQFPRAIRYYFKDLDTGKTYESIDNELSISWNGNEVYDRYAQEPCDRVIAKDFATELKDIYFSDLPDTAPVNFELHAYYLNFTSNILVFRDTPLELKGF